MKNKYLKKHVGTEVYCARHGKGVITLVEENIVHVQHANTRARYRASDGDNGAGVKLHFFARQ
jgi:hypothetical protein